MAQVRNASGGVVPRCSTRMRQISPRKLRCCQLGPLPPRRQAPDGLFLSNACRVLVSGAGPSARYAHTLSLVANRFLVAMGVDDGKSTLGDAWALDTSEKPYAWRKITDAGEMPSPRQGQDPVFQRVLPLPARPPARAGCQRPCPCLPACSLMLPAAARHAPLQDVRHGGGQERRPAAAVRWP